MGGGKFTKILVVRIVVMKYITDALEANMIGTLTIKCL